MIEMQLMCRILGGQVEFLELNGNIIVYQEFINGNDIVKKINKFEFISDCKSWALENGFVLLSGTVKDNSGLVIVNNIYDKFLFTSCGDSECLAVAKACQILSEEINDFLKENKC